MTDTENTTILENELEVTPEMLCAASAAYWATYREIKLQSGVYSLKDHEYQHELLDSRDKRICVRKSTQMGITEVMVLKSLHGMIYGLFKSGVLYVFPTGQVSADFGKARFAPLIAKNRAAIGRYVRNTDSASIKGIRDSFLYLRSGRLSQKVDGEDESASMRGVPCDMFVLDEFDLMDEDVLLKARGRLGHSDVGMEVCLSNPVLPGSGIDGLWLKSDQRYWQRKCDACGTYTCAELSFPKCVKRDSEGKGYIACDKCGKPVRTSAGEWQPSIPSNTDMAGYHLSQLSSTFHDPWNILQAIENPPNGNLADVYRLTLGLPYVATEDKLQESQVLGCCGDYLPMTGHPGPTALGCDVGKTLHCVIGVRTGSDQYEIVRTMQLPSMDDLYDVFKRYNVKSAVLDIRPYEDSARKVQSNCGFPCFLCQYSESSVTGPQFGNNGIVKANRTEILDKTHRMVTTPGMLKIPRFCEETKLFAAQMCGTAKVAENDKRSGTITYRYRPVGTAGDHFRHALNYFALAASGGKVARFTRDTDVKKQRKAINNFRVGA